MTGPGAGPVVATGGEGAAKVCGIVLAGGHSRRMGRDKAALPWAESTMLGTVVETQRAVLAHVIVVAARGQQLPAVDAEIVRDRLPDQGPLRGLATGLAAAAAAGYEWAFAAATDTPLLTEHVVREVLAADPEADVAVAVAGGRDQPLIARYRTGMLPDLEAALAANAADSNLGATVTLTFNAGGTFDVSGSGTGNPSGLSYTAGRPIEFNGWSLTLQGMPRPGDTVTVQAAAPGYTTLNAGNAGALLGLRDKALFDGAPTSDGYAALMAKVGVRVQSAQYTAEVSTSIAGSLEAERSNVAGVNLDEEAAKLLQYQQAYQASAKMIQIAQNIFDSLLREMN